MRLSANFTLEELTRSEAAARNGIDMTPPDDVIANLMRLCIRVLEPIRSAAQAPIVVTSGYRPEALNKLIGGAPASDHMKGLAADIHALGMGLDQLGRVIRTIAPGLPLKKCIREFPPGGWIHVAVMPNADPAPREFLVATRSQGHTVYEAWT